jgi:hypothetical protein
VLPAGLRYCHVELARQRSVRHDEPGEPRAVLYGPRRPLEGDAASRFVACADRVVCAGTICLIGATAVGFIGAATGRFIDAASDGFIGAADTAYRTTIRRRATEARRAESRRGAATGTATVA